MLEFTGVVLARLRHAYRKEMSSVIVGSILFFDSVLQFIAKFEVRTLYESQSILRFRHLGSVDLVAVKRTGRCGVSKSSVISQV